MRSHLASTDQRNNIAYLQGNVVAGVRGRRMARPAGRAEAGGWRLERRRGRVEPRTGRRRRREQLKRRSDREPGAAATGGTRSRVCLILFYFFVYIHMDCVL